MSRWLPNRLRRTVLALGLDAQSLAYAWQDTKGLEHVTVHDWRADPVTTVRHILMQGSAGSRKNSVHLIAGAGLAFHWIQAPPKALASLAELRLVANSRCSQLYGDGDWMVVGDWNAQRPFVCAAIARGTLSALCEALQAHDLAIHWYTSWGLLCSLQHRVFPSNGWSAIRTPGQILMWHCSAGLLDSLTTLPASIEEDAVRATDRALQHMRIETLRTSHLTLGTLNFLDLTAARDTAHASADIEPLWLGMQEQPAPCKVESVAALSLGRMLGNQRSGS